MFDKSDYMTYVIPKIGGGEKRVKVYSPPHNEFGYRHA